MDVLVRVQARVRGFLERRKYRIQKLANESVSKYFKPEEALETLTQSKFDPKAPLKQRTHNYKSGAIYTGQWKGNLRHGNGTMIWPDGGRYQGEWSHN